MDPPVKASPEVVGQKLLDGLGFERTDGVTIIQIFQQGRTAGQKQRAYSSCRAGWKLTAASHRPI